MLVLLAFLTPLALTATFLGRLVRSLGHPGQATFRHGFGTPMPARREYASNVCSLHVMGPPISCESVVARRAGSSS